MVWTNYEAGSHFRYTQFALSTITKKKLTMLHVTKRIKKMKTEFNFVHPLLKDHVLRDLTFPLIEIGLET